MTSIEIFLYVAIILLLWAYRRLKKSHSRNERLLNAANSLKHYYSDKYETERLINNQLATRNGELRNELLQEREKTKDYVKRFVSDETERLESELAEVKERLRDYETNADEELADLIQNSGYAI